MVALSGLNPVGSIVVLKSGVLFTNAEGERGRTISVLVDGREVGRCFFHERFGKVGECEVSRGVVRWRFVAGDVKG
jgi:hypothetical protein